MTHSTYEVDTSSEGTLVRYEAGENLPWQMGMSFDSFRDAEKCAKHYLANKVTGVRIVRVDDPEENPEPHDIFVKFNPTVRFCKVPHCGKKPEGINGLCIVHLHDAYGRVLSDALQKK